MQTINFKNISPDSSSNTKDVNELLKILESYLPLFYNSEIFIRDIYDKSGEDHYTETLIKFLENEIDSRFSFKQQVLQKDRRTSDIGIHLKADSEHYLFCVEAKFLPHSPNDYVQGNYAAIKRFKMKEHGLSNTNPAKAIALTQSGIIAYVTRDSFQNHLNLINNKIVDLSKSKKNDTFGMAWHKKEILKEKYFSNIGKLKSNHQRVDDSFVTLHHFWINVSTK